MTGDRSRDGRPRIVVIGGGITGLAAAHALVRAAPAAHVTLLEAAEALGGKVRAGPFAGLPSVECGADMFLARTPAAVDLVTELGLAGELVAPAALPALVWSEGRLHALPEGLVLGAPARLWPLATSGLLSWRGKARAAIEPVLPRRDRGDSVGAVIRGRFGDQVLERLVGPLIGGINAGDPDRLSLGAVTPQLAEAMTGRRSLLLGLRAQARARPSGQPASPFLAPRSGVSTIVHRLTEAIGAGGGDIQRESGVRALAAHAGGGWTVMTETASLSADAVILTAPAPAAAGLLRAISPSASAALGSIDYASVAMVTLAVPEASLTRAVPASGYLVPRHEQRTITACSWGSAKWEQWRQPGQTVLRISAGRDGDEHALDLDDAYLTAAVLADLERHVGLEGDPTAVRITRWRQAMPQYRPGHVERVDALIGTMARDAPGLHLAGAAYRGLGLPACIAQGQAAARAALATVGQG